MKRGDSYAFAGVINGMRLAVLIRASEEEDRESDVDNDDNGNDRCRMARYTLRAKGLGPELKGTTNPVTVTISIDDNTGTSEVNARFGR